MSTEDENEFQIEVGYTVVTIYNTAFGVPTFHVREFFFSTLLCFLISMAQWQCRRLPGYCPLQD